MSGPFGEVVKMPPHRPLTQKRYMTFRYLPDGVREITHPSGVVVRETREDRKRQRDDLLAMRDERTAQIAAMDLEESKINGQ